MDEKVFKHFLQELIDSSRTGDVQKLLVQARYFDDLSLSQQMEAGTVVKSNITPTLLLKVYKAVLDNDLFARRNPVLRKLLKDSFLSDYAVLREAAAMVPVTDQRAVDFIESCLTECSDQSIADEFHIRKRAAESPLQHRQTDLKHIEELSGEGSDEAVAGMIADAGTDIGLNIVVISRLSALHTESSIRGLIHFLGSASSKVRAYASAKLEEIGTAGADSLIRELDIAAGDPNPDKAIAILTVLNKTARAEHVKMLRKSARKMPEHTNMRVALYETLVKLDPEGSAPLLMEQICDGSDDIAYFAAGMLDAHCSERVVQGISNIIDSSLISLKRLAEIIVFSKSKNLASRLSADTSFFTALSEFCALPGMETYAQLFGLREPVVEETLPKTDVWAVDDSKMILRMYEKYAVEAGVSVKTFESGKLLLDSMMSEKPALLFVDLNMPEINGIDLAHRLDELGWGSVPRILVTTQEDAGNDEEIQNGLFKEIVHKPFTSDMLITASNRYL